MLPRLSLYPLMVNAYQNTYNIHNTFTISADFIENILI